MKGDETTNLVVPATEMTLRAVNPIDGSVGEHGSRRCRLSAQGVDPGLATDTIGVFSNPPDPILGYYKNGDGEFGKYSVPCLTLPVYHKRSERNENSLEV